MGPPKTEVQTILPNQELPGGLLALRDPRGWNETPLWLPEHHTLVFADALTERAGVLRVWMSPTHEDRALPDLRSMLDLPFERVIISHGEPVHTRDAFKRASSVSFYLLARARSSACRRIRHAPHWRSLRTSDLHEAVGRRGGPFVEQLNGRITQRLGGSRARASSLPSRVATASATNIRSNLPRAAVCVISA
jgi:hypothetical protein